MSDPVDPALRCLVLTGPTATGKSAAAMAIAAAFASMRPVEIVSVDSAQVFCGMDIGTAKPDAVERAAVPHHLIDILDPSRAYSAARFAADAERTIGEITGRGGLALLVGGTFLYLKALFDGLHALPSSPQARAELQAALAADGVQALHARLAEVDPPTAARLPSTDTQRILRALEVHAASGGVALSTFHAQPRPAGRWPPVISLEPQSRAWLHARIDARFAAMLDAGLVDEVRRLRDRGDLTADTPSMRCVGYRQTWAALDSGDFSALHAQGAAATRQLAKRQSTWLRSRPDRHVVDADAPDALARTVSLARTLGDALRCSDQGGAILSNVL